MEGCVTGCQEAVPAHSEFCSPPLLRFLLAMGLCQNGEEEKDVNQSSTSEFSCFLCWKNRVHSGWQADPHL